MHTKIHSTHNSNQWLKQILDSFDQNISILVSYFSIQPLPYFENVFIRLQNIHYQMQMFGYILAKIPMAGNSNNLAYTKQLFYNNKGFTLFNETLAGEDNLFVNINATPENIIVNLDKDAFVTSTQDNWSKWKFDKKNYIRTLKYYKGFHQLLIFIYVFSQILFNLLFISTAVLMIVNKVFLPIIMYAFIIKFIIQNLIYFLIFKKLKEKALYKWIPLMDWIITGYYFMMGVQYFKSAKYHNR